MQQAQPAEQYQMLRNVSRTFALSIEQLPGTLRETVTIAYLMFRVADCLEDHEDLPAADKAALLRLWAGVLSGSASPLELTGAIAGLDSSEPEVYVAQRADRIVALLEQLPEQPRGILRDHVVQTSLGMAAWQEHGPFVADEQEMDDYMFHVAGRVGYLLTDVFAWYSPAISRIRTGLMPLAREFGLALQTVNVIRGMRKDYERGWVFVPRTFYERAGLTRDSLFIPANIQQALRVVDMLADKAERHLRNGFAYITMLPRMVRRIRLFCIWPLLFAVRTLAVSRNNASVLSAEAKITRTQVKSIVTISNLCFWSNRLLKALYERLDRAVVMR
jgi:farnesyl-diphosphate farnesyltransferase